MSGASPAAVTLLMVSALATVVYGQSFTVTAEIVEGCALVGTSDSSGLDFGTLNFGTYPAIYSGNVTASAVGAGGPVQVECTSGLTMQVDVDGGQHLSGSQRRLLHGGSGDVVPYALFTTASHAVPIPVSTPVSVVIPPAGVITLPIFGVATLSGTGLTPGAYTDLLQVTLSW